MSLHVKEEVDSALTKYVNSIKRYGIGFYSQITNIIKTGLLYRDLDIDFAHPVSL